MFERFQLIALRILVFFLVLVIENTEVQDSFSFQILKNLKVQLAFLQPDNYRVNEYSE